MKTKIKYQIVLITIFLFIAGSSLAQAPSVSNDAAIERFKLSLSGIASSGIGMTSSSTNGLKEIGVATTDLIRGNGSKAGYMLGHGAIVDVSETVTVGGVTKRRNVDYYLDYASGTIVFAEPVRPNDTIKVYYRYVPGKEGVRGGISIPALSFNVGSRNTVGLLFSSNAAINYQGYDIMTYGLNLKTSLGKKSSMTNMLYLSTPQESNRQSLLSGAAPKGEKPKADNLFVHNSVLESGSVSVKLNYQDVGKDFAGFTALKQQNVEAIEMLNQLEKEKDIRRLGMQADIKMGAKTTSALGFNRISDAGGDILKQSFNIGSDKLKLSANMQRIDKGFTRFNDLAEAERGQWAKERGMSRSNIQLSMAPTKGMSAESAWNALSMNTISTETGKLSTTNLNFATKKLSLSSSQIKIDSGFNRINDLTQEEQTAMALNIYKQFDPNATEANVKDEDRKRLQNEAGLSRRNTRLGFTTGANSALQLNMFSIGDQSGGISRQSLSLTGKSYSISAFTQEIDSTFTRLQSLANVEKANFGNEIGMRRTNIAGNFILNPKMQLATTMSKVSSDAGGLSKYGLNFSSEKLKLAANYMNMDTEFTRAGDLADADKGRLLTEQGMRRYDLATQFQASKSLKIDSYLYDAKSNSTDLFRKQLRNSLSFSPVKGPKLSALIDQFSTGTPDAISGYSHQKYTFDHMISKINLSAMKDTLVKIDPLSEKTIDTTKLHFNTDMSKPMNLTGDINTIKNSDGTFQDHQVYKFNTMLNKKVAFLGVRSTFNTEASNTTMQEYSVSGKVMGKVSMAAKFGETLLNGVTVGKVRELSLKPDAVKDYGAFKQTNWQVGFGQVQNGGKIQTESKILKLDTNLIKHKLDMQYVSGITKEGASSIVKSVSIIPDPDPKRKINYSLAYKAKDTGAPQTVLIRAYNADWQITPYSKLIYNYFSNTEKPDGTIEPVGSESLKLTSAISKNIGLQGQWEHSSSDKIGSQFDKNTLSLGLAGKLSAKGTFEAGYGFDNVLSKNGRVESRTYRIKYNQQIDADHYLSLSGRYTDWQGPKPASVTTDDVQYQIDFKTVY